jgi:hypothetical protein
VAVPLKFFDDPLDANVYGGWFSGLGVFAVGSDGEFAGAAEVLVAAHAEAVRFDYDFTASTIAAFRFRFFHGSIIAQSAGVGNTEFVKIVTCCNTLLCKYLRHSETGTLQNNPILFLTCFHPSCIDRIE